VKRMCRYNGLTLLPSPLVVSKMGPLLKVKQ
jgi:hypothetical protein